MIARFKAASAEASSILALLWGDVSWALDALRCFNTGSWGSAERFSDWPPSYAGEEAFVEESVLLVVSFEC